MDEGEAETEAEPVDDPVAAGEVEPDPEFDTDPDDEGVVDWLAVVE